MMDAHPHPEARYRARRCAVALANAAEIVRQMFPEDAALAAQLNRRAQQMAELGADRVQL